MTWQTISVIDPISPAIERVKTLLFRPFDLEKWFTIGFCAWLANLGRGGGNPFSNIARQHHQSCGQLKNFITEHLPFIIIFCIIGTITVMVIGLLVTWLSSRGRFMFLHCVAENKAEVKLPWAKFKIQANSLFLFRIVVGMISLVTIILPAIFGSISIYMMSCSSSLNLMQLFSGITFFLITTIFIIVFAMISKFTTDFVVPIMFLTGLKTVDGWRQFRNILFTHKGAIALYILFQIVIGMAISAIVITATLLTCCMACCFLAIPYIGTVVLLPLLVFKRSYSLYFLRQFGPQFDVFGGGNVNVAEPVITI